jgi:hypothetical protein
MGCVPGCIALYFRLTIPETPRFTMDIERNVKRAAEDIDGVVRGVKTAEDEEIIIQRADVPKASWADFSEYFGKWENMKVLIGTSWSWFALDVCRIRRLMLFLLTIYLHRSLFTGSVSTLPSFFKPSVSVRPSRRALEGCTIT